MITQIEIKAVAVTEHTITVRVDENDDSGFEFTFRADGAGSCRDLYCGSEPVSFTWNPCDIEGLQGDARSEALRELAQKLFWDEINYQLGDDRVLQAEDWGSEEVSFETGSSEELERVVRIILYSFPSLWEDAREKLSLTVYSATEDDPAGIDDYCDFMQDAEVPEKIRQAVRELTSFVLGWNSPSGAHLEYNDGAAGRASGYYDSPNALWYSIPRPSFHELAEAREQLLASFAEHDSRNEAEVLLRAGE